MGERSKKKPLTPSMGEVMDELQSRFLVNLPASELTASERLFFQIEQCYWFYEDFYADQFAHLQHLKLHDFAKQMFAHCPLLQPVAHECENMFQDFKLYQSQVPVVGCILLNAQRNKLVLVRNWKGTSWSFPRGKVNQGETDRECARREVMEECGYDVGDTLSEKLYIEFVHNQQRMRMYLAKNVPESHAFAPQTRKEISLIQWFEFDSIPKKTWCVMPFMARLRRWVNRDKAKDKQSRSSTPGKAPRAASAPRNRPVTAVLTNPNKNNLVERSMSTPHGRSINNGGRKTARGHFGTEQQTATSYDGVNDETFGSASVDFSVEEMFSVNERITGHKFVYDGNPHDFGKPRSASTPLFNHNAGVVPFQVLGRPAPMKKVEEEGPSSTASTPSKHSQAPFGSFQFDMGDIMACVN